MTRDALLRFLREYGRPARIMEVCGTHTRAIMNSGLRSLVSPQIQLLSGPGCPVCVSPAGFIGSLCEKAAQPTACVLSFGDLLRVPGPTGSLADAKARGGHVRAVISPFMALEMAKSEPNTQFVFAAVGFETTAPLYAVMLETMERECVQNLRLMTALRTMPAALDFLCRETEVDAFLCPGHVSALVGCRVYEPLAARYHRPFIVAGFEPDPLLIALYHALRQLDLGEGRVENLYPSAVSDHGNTEAQRLVERFFAPCDANWRGIGEIASSGLRLRSQYARYAVPYDETDDVPEPGCRCGDVMLGRITPDRCPLFGKACAPDRPVGACMVSAEGACGIWHGNGGRA